MHSQICFFTKQTERQYTDLSFRANSLPELKISLGNIFYGQRLPECLIVQKILVVVMFRNALIETDVLHLLSHIEAFLLLHSWPILPRVRFYNLYLQRHFLCKSWLKTLLWLAQTTKMMLSVHKERLREKAEYRMDVSWLLQARRMQLTSSTV